MGYQRHQGKLIRRFRKSMTGFLCLLLLLMLSTWSSGPAQARTYFAHTATTSCPAVQDPAAQSKLIVLLDRSGSLVAQPGATDPDGYSTSVTKALVDLWPGSIIVIPFANDQINELAPGIVASNDLAQQAILKQNIDTYPITGNTPLEPAMVKSLTLLKNAPSGSKMIIITDGDPTNSRLEPSGDPAQAIQKLIPQFCSMGIPITTFGLTLAKGSVAYNLLGAIAMGTGGDYRNVQNPSDLAELVVGLFARWQHLNLDKAPAPGDYSFQVTPFAQQIKVVVFRAQEVHQITLLDPGSHPVTGIQPTTDRHYVIATLHQAAFVNGMYTVETGNDPNAQVYVLTRTTIQVKIVAPIILQQRSDRPVHIEAHLINTSNGDIIAPAKNSVTLIATVKLIANGQQVGPPHDLTLLEQGTSFTINTDIYHKEGQLQIEVTTTYGGLQLSDTTRLQLIPPPIPPRPLCSPGDTVCLLKHWMQVQARLLLACIVALFLLLLAIRLTRPTPFGVLTNRGSIEPLRRRRRSPGRSLFHPGTIYSDELKRSIDLENARFSLLFKRGRQVYLKAASDEPPIRIHQDGEEKSVTKRGGPILLQDDDAIIVGNSQIATFNKTMQEEEEEDDLFR